MYFRGSRSSSRVLICTYARGEICATHRSGASHGPARMTFEIPAASHRSGGILIVRRIAISSGA
jgi:hypothetical protein